ncbi:predicted protein [Postia placenta Mad-698-R]|nr:predicted protein [Postia placenta Mad-698-R]
MPAPICHLWAWSKTFANWLPQLHWVLVLSLLPLFITVQVEVLVSGSEDVWELPTGLSWLEEQMKQLEARKKGFILFLAFGQSLHPPDSLTNSHKHVRVQLPIAQDSALVIGFYVLLFRLSGMPSSSASSSSAMLGFTSGAYSSAAAFSHVVVVPCVGFPSVHIWELSPPPQCQFSSGIIFSQLLMAARLVD